MRHRIVSMTSVFSYQIAQICRIDHQLIVEDILHGIVHQPLEIGGVEQCEQRSKVGVGHYIYKDVVTLAYLIVINLLNVYVLVVAADVFP